MLGEERCRGRRSRGAVPFALRCAPSVSQSAYKRIDHAVYRAERALVVASLLVMAVVVFLDVVHRSFSGEDSKFATAIAKVAGWFGVEILPDTAQYQQLVDASPWVLLVVFIGLTYFGIRSTKREVPISPPIAMAGAVAGVLATYGLVRLLLVVMPNGLIWSQTLALLLTLWVGFIGASMCTYENRHLRVEAVQRFLPEKIRPLVGFASGLLTTVVCLVLLWLSIRYVRFNYEEYVITEGKGGLFLGMDMPKYLGFAALPIAFAFMAIRFSVKALAALRGEVEEPLDPVAAAGGAPAPDVEGRMPSEVATEALVAPGSSADDEDEDEDDEEDDDSDDGEPMESSIDTMTSLSEMSHDTSVPRPQSKVPTDAHPVLADILAATKGEIGKDKDPAEDEDEGEDDPNETREVEGPIVFSEDTTSRGVLGDDDAEGDR